MPCCTSAIGLTEKRCWGKRATCPWHGETTEEDGTDAILGLGCFVDLPPTRFSKSVGGFDGQIDRWMSEWMDERKQRAKGWKEIGTRVRVCRTRTGRRVLAECPLGFSMAPGYYY
mmetsp:Transcript_4012/g.8742  ORF Transcript_4012/g.8742 Transcript_4012/m.8742 type:complete len:115 (-) Transcript_4012:210-554(-)